MRADPFTQELHVYGRYELEALRCCAKELYLNHSVIINKLRIESLALRMKTESLMYKPERLMQAHLELNERFSKTIQEALYEEGVVLNEGILDFFKGLFRAFLALFGIGVEEKEKEAIARYVNSANKEIARQTPEGQKAGTWEKLRPKEVKRDFGIVATYSQRIANDALTKSNGILDGFLAKNIAAVPPPQGTPNEGLVLEQKTDPYANNTDDLKALADGVGQLRGAIGAIAPHSKEFDNLLKKLKGNSMSAPIDLVQQMAIGANALGPLSNEPDVAKDIVRKAAEYITDAGGSTGAIDDASVAISTTLPGAAGDAATAAGQVDENDMRDAADAASVQLEQGAEEAQTGIIDKIKAALTKWIKATGITDPCAYVEENKAQIESELKTLENGMQQMKSGGMDLNKKLGVLGTMFGAFGTASFPAAALAATETAAATTAFVVTNPAAVAKAGVGAITGGGSAALGSLVQHATILGLKAASWLTLGKVLLVTAAIIMVYRYLLKEGHLCTVKELIDGIATPLQSLTGSGAKRILSGALDSIKGWADTIWSKIRGKKNEARIAIVHGILCEEFDIKDVMYQRRMPLVDDYRDMINTAALEWVEIHEALEGCLGSVNRMSAQ